jgi:hypothetical protein
MKDTRQQLLVVLQGQRRMGKSAIYRYDSAPIQGIQQEVAVV